VASSSRSRFFLYTTIAIAVVVFIGFSRTFYLRGLFPEAQELAASEPIFLIHGIVLSAWFLFLVLQAALVSYRKVALHRALGLFGAVISAGVIGLGIYGAAVAANRPGGFIGIEFSSEQFFIIPFTTMVFFGTFVALAVGYRKKPEYHKRLMLLATVNLLEAAIIRFPLAIIPAYAPLTSFGPALLFIVALGIYDRRTKGRVHRVTLWGGIAIALSLPVAFLLSGTQVWQSFAEWLIGALGT
jgi:hypothetical protein